MPPSAKYYHQEANRQPTRLFGEAGGGLWEGSRQGVLPTTPAAGDLVPPGEPRPPHPSAGDPPTLAGVWITSKQSAMELPSGYMLH